MKHHPVALIAELLKSVDIDPERPAMRETPSRFYEALAFWTQGYRQKPADVLKFFDDGVDKYDEVVFQGNIPMYSLCEHHLTPFFGVAHIAYIPQRRVIGLSKIARIADIFARRLQMQERLTIEIADALDEGLAPLAVGVVLRCRHLCMESRGVQKTGTITYTSALRGAFKAEASAREEFLRFVALADARTTSL